MEKFTVVQLKWFHRERSLKTTETKNELIRRLVENLEVHQIEPTKFAEEYQQNPSNIDNVHPEDSVSQVSKASSQKSIASQASSELLKQAVRKAELEARETYLLPKQANELQKIKLEQEKELIEFNAQMAEVQAK